MFHGILCIVILHLFIAKSIVVKHTLKIIFLKRATKKIELIIFIDLQLIKFSVMLTVY